MLHSLFTWIVPSVDHYTPLAMIVSAVSPVCLKCGSWFIFPLLIYKQPVGLFTPSSLPTAYSSFRPSFRSHSLLRPTRRRSFIFLYGFSGTRTFCYAALPRPVRRTLRFWRSCLFLSSSTSPRTRLKKLRKLKPTSIRAQSAPCGCCTYYSSVFPPVLFWEKN